MTHAQEELFSTLTPEVIDTEAFAAQVAADALGREPKPERTSEAYHDLGGNVPVAPFEAPDTSRISARKTAHGYYGQEFHLTGPVQPTEEQQRIAREGAARARKLLGIIKE